MRRPPCAFDRWFDQPARLGPGEPTERRYLETLCRGGYPEIVSLDPLPRRLVRQLHRDGHPP